MAKKKATQKKKATPRRKTVSKKHQVSPRSVKKKATTRKQCTPKDPSKAKNLEGRRGRGVEGATQLCRNEDFIQFTAECILTGDARWAVVMRQRNWVTAYEPDRPEPDINTLKKVYNIALDRIQRNTTTSLDMAELKVRLALRYISILQDPQTKPETSLKAGERLEELLGLNAKYVSVAEDPQAAAEAYRAALEEMQAMHPPASAQQLDEGEKISARSAKLGKAMNS